MKILYLVMAGCFVFLSGCSGFIMRSEKRTFATESISKSAYSVTFCGNAYMDGSEAEKLTMQRACEITLTKGYTHFEVLTKSDLSETCAAEDTSRAHPKQASFVGPQNIVRPNLTLKIQCYHAKDAPKTAIDAQKYIDDNFPGLKFKK